MRSHERLRVDAARARAAAAAFAPLAWGVVVLYSFFAITDLAVDAPAAHAMAPLDAAIVVAAGFLLLMRARGLPAHAATTVLFGFVIVASLVRIGVSQEPLLAIQLLLIQLVAGALVFSPVSLALIHAGAVSGWFAVAGPRMGQAGWAPWHFVLASGLVVSIVLAWTRLEMLTRSERQAATLEESEARYRALVEGVPDGICVLVDARIVYANPAALRIFGAATLRDLLGRPGPTLITPESADLIEKRTRAVEQDGVATAPIEVQGRRLDGEIVELEIWGLPVAYEGRRADLSIVRDITERKHAQEQGQRLTEVSAEQAVTRDLVRRMLSESARGASMRNLGRSLAQDVPAVDLEDYAHAFAAMGFGSVHPATTADGRYVVVGHDLLERRAENAQPTCDMALGYLEGAVTRLEGHDALGTETQCQSQGYPRCTFVVRTRRAASAMPPGQVGKRS